MPTRASCGAKERENPSMAIYHLSAKAVSRSSGRSATASAAYRSAERITDKRTGEIHNYTRKKGVVSTQIITPHSAGEWVKERNQLWNAAELAERRKDACVAREIVVALPAELNAKERERLVIDFAREMAAVEGCAVDTCIHEPNRAGDDRNHHAHLMRTTRVVGKEGLEGKLESEKAGRNRKADLERLRSRWAELVNERLKENGFSTHVDHRSLEAQGIDRLPTQHMGPDATAFERRTGEKSNMRLTHEEARPRHEEEEVKAPEVPDINQDKAALSSYREEMRNTLKSADTLKRLGDNDNHHLMEMHERYQQVKPLCEKKNARLSKWSNELHEGDRYKTQETNKLHREKSLLDEFQEQRSKLSGIRGIFRWSEKRNLDEKIAGQRTVVDEMQKAVDDSTGKLEKSRDAWRKEYGNYHDSEEYKRYDSLRFREREMDMAVKNEAEKQTARNELNKSTAVIEDMNRKYGLSDEKMTEIREEVRQEEEKIRTELQQKNIRQSQQDQEWER